MRTRLVIGIAVLGCGLASGAARAQSFGSAGVSAAYSLGGVAVSDQRLSATVSHVGLGGEPVSTGPAASIGNAALGGNTQQYATGVVMANVNTGSAALVQQAVSLAIVAKSLSLK